jgi:hypothetical protein
VPGLGRYAEGDPLGIAAGTNIYSYADQAPEKWSGPDGRCIPWCIGAIIWGFSSVITTGNTVGWSWSNLGTIAVAGAIGAAVGGFGALPLEGFSAAEGAYLGGVESGFFGDIVGQLWSHGGFCGFSLSEALLQSLLGGVSGILGAIPTAFLSEGYAALTGSGLSAAFTLFEQTLLPTEAGGFGFAPIGQNNP